MANEFDRPAPPPDRIRWSGADAAILAALAAAAVVLTWPLCRDFTTRLGGDHGDNWQTLWGFWWVREALASGRSPFATDLLHHPLGVPLTFQTLVLPEALWTAWIPSPLVAFNAALFGSFVLSAWAMYGLAREVCGARGPAAVAAVAYAFGPYHFSHALGHMHLCSMHWVPLFAWALVRSSKPGTSARYGAACGALAALAGMASPYSLMACGAIALFWAPWLWRQSRLPLRTVLLLAAAALAAFLAVAAPWLASLPFALSRRPYEGSHPAWFFSADLWAFLVPGARSLWSALSAGLWTRFTGNSAENGVQLGWALLGLSLWGAWKVRGARPLFALALLGVVLSLGPQLHVAGAVRDLRLPWGWLADRAPLLAFSGVPVRLAYWATFALPLCAALALATRKERWPSAAAAAMILIEFWPLPFVQSENGVPPPMRAWAESAEPFAVIDLSGDTRNLFHQTIHRKPLVGGYVTRTPRENERWLRATPVVNELVFAPRPVRREVLTRLDPAIDFDWGGGAPAPGMASDHFQARWTGGLVVPQDGEYELFLTSDDGSRLVLDGALAIDNGGEHPAQTRSARLALRAGTHPLQLDFQEREGRASIRLEWSGPSQPRAVVPPSALGGGLAGVYTHEVNESGLGREGGRAELRKLGVRYVVLPAHRRESLVEQDLALPLVYEGEGVRIYEVPPPAA